MKKAYVFISREHKLDGLALVLYKVLKDEIEVYLDQDDQRIGRQFAPKILTALNKSTHMVLVWGKTTEQSFWVNQEVGFAICKGIPILPLIQKDVSLRGMMAGVEAVTYDEDDPLSGARQIVGALQDEFCRGGYPAMNLAGIQRHFEMFSDIYAYVRDQTQVKGG